MPESSDIEEIVVPEALQEKVAGALSQLEDENNGVGNADLLHAADGYIAAAIRIAVQKLLAGTPISVSANEVMQVAKDDDSEITDDGQAASNAATQVLKLVKDALGPADA